MGKCHTPDEASTLPAQFYDVDPSAPLQAFFETTLDCVIILDREGRFTYVNQRGLKELVFGRDVLGHYIWDVFGTGANPVFEQKYWEAVETGLEQRFEGYSNYLQVWFDVHARPLANGMVVCFRNISERKHAEQLVHEDRKQLQSVLDAIPQMVWTATPSGECTYLSRRWYEFTGRPIGSDIGTLWLEAVHCEDRERTWASWSAAAAAGSSFECEFRLRASDGSYRWIEAKGSPHQDVDQNVIWCGTCTDVHERVLAQQAKVEADHRVEKILNSIPHVVWSAGADGAPDFVNSYWSQQHGGEPIQAKGYGWLDAAHPADRATAKRCWSASVAAGTPHEAQFRMRAESGEYRWTHVRAVPEKGDADRVVRWYGTCTDVHESVLTEQALRESEILYRSVLEASADCIKIIDLNGKLKLMNAPGVCAMELPCAETVLGQDWGSLWPTVAQEAVRRAVADAATGKTARFTGFCPTAKGTPKWWDVVVTPMRGNDGEVTDLLSISRDITSQRETSEQLRWASEHDALTALPNRRSFQAHLQASIIKAMETGETVGLLLLDLDHFKHVNDTLGHAAGDHLLNAFAQRLKSSVRATDLVARLGGDEFAVVLRGIRSEDDLLSTGNSILERLTQPIKYDGRTFTAGASIGGAMFPQDASSAHELFNNADTALYALKAAGRGGTGMFHNHMRAEAQKVASQLSLARSVISEDSVVPHYQQKVELSSGSIRGFEALLRWHHFGSGLQHPASVAEAFKDYELASKIGELMQRKVFSDMAAWLKRGVQFGCISINAAPAEFLRDDYAERLLHRLKEHEVPPHLLEVEVTEHVFLDRASGYVSRALSLLHEAGVQISLDDFGTGYSSLSHLRDYPVDVVKIDRSFVSKITEQPEIAAIVTAVIDLTASLSMKVVAEGVETKEQVDILRGKGCTLGQGYYYGRACSADDVPLLVSSSCSLAA